MKYLFIVQGEGRGHLSQALALDQILTNAGHEICCVMVGESVNRQLPFYFTNKIKTKLFRYKSPDFIKSIDNKGIDLLNTIIINLLKSVIFLKSIRYIKRKTDHYQPDVVVNFYEPLVGLAYKIYTINSLHIAIAHHFLTEHQDFPMPDKMSVSRKLLFCLNQITGYGALKVMALSFQPMATFRGNNKFVVSPPLLREEVLKSPVNTEDFIMGYMLNYGYYGEVVKWHQKNPEIKAVFFWDHPDSPEKMKVNDNLFFYKPDGEKFIAFLASCKGYISSAGFESVCEAICFNKPFIVIPVKNHFEQLCNACDAQKTGKGLMANQFDPDILLQLINSQKNLSNHNDFQNWFRSAPDFYLKHLTNI